jgi:phytoene/squalene synthetase
MTSQGLGRAFHGGQHYENFPVASWLIPASLRPSVVQLYRFARTGDDLADEGSLTMAQRQAGLTLLRQGLWDRPYHTEGLDLGPLEPANLYTLGQRTGKLFTQESDGREWADRLLQAFEYDATFQPFQDWPAVLQYCRKSAAPVGRLMLGLFGLWSPEEPGQDLSGADREAGLTGLALIAAESDAICMGLQLVNFAQDIHQDLTRHRPTLPVSEWPEDWSFTPTEGPEKALRLGDRQGETTREDRIRITRALALRGLHQLARGRDLPKRIEATRIPHARRLAFEISLTLEGGTQIGERLLKRPLLAWKASTRLSRLWLALVLVNRLPRMFFKTPL